MNGGEKGMKLVIMANDIGERLWPLTNKGLPKALLPLYSKNSMLVETLLRCMPLCDSGKDVFIVSTTQAKKKIREEKIHTEFKIPLKNVLTIDEPNAVYQVIQGFAEQFDDDEIILFVPADQFFWPEEGFQFHISNTVLGIGSYPGDVLALALQPGMPAGNMRYLKVDMSGATIVGKALTPKTAIDGSSEPLTTMLVEPTECRKPVDIIEAENLLLEGWVWDLNTLVSTLGTFKAHLSDTDDPVYDLVSSGHIRCTLANKVVWSVLDNWAALKYLTYDAGLFPVTDEPKVHSIDSSRNLVKKNAEKEIILIGVDDLVIIDTEDKLLIATPGGLHEHL